MKQDKPILRQDTGGRSRLLAGVSLASAIALLASAETAWGECIRNDEKADCSPLLQVGFVRSVIVEPSEGEDFVLTHGPIETSSDNSPGILARTTGRIEITGIGPVRTSGDRSSGIIAHGDYNDIVVTERDIRTTGAASHGIDLFGRYSATINAHDIKTGGRDSSAIYVDLNDGFGTINITGDLRTTGTNAPAIHALLSGSYSSVNISNLGTIATSGSNSAGILGQGNFGSCQFDSWLYICDILSVAVDNQGLISTSGDHSPGIDITAFSAAGVSGYGSVVTTGAGSSGINVLSQSGGAYAYANSVVTSGDFSGGIGANGYYSASVVADAIVTTGNNAGAIRATGYEGSAYVEVGTVSTRGSASDGIVALAYSGAYVTVTEAISTQGNDAGAIYADGYFRTVIDAGTVTTLGANAPGIVARTRAASAWYEGDIQIRAGTVVTAGDGSAAIDAVAAGEDNVFIYGDAAYGDVSIAYGSITTLGANAPAILASTGQGDVSITGDGPIHTMGDQSSAIIVRNRAATVNTDNNNVYVNVGQISTAGQQSAGIDAAARNNNIVIASRVTTIGDNATAIRSIGGDGIAKVSADMVSTDGVASSGIIAQALGGVFVSVDQSVGTRGDDATAIFADGGIHSSVNVDTVATLGHDASAIVIRGDTLTREAVDDMPSISIDAGTIGTRGQRSIGIDAQSSGEYGNIAIALGSLSTEGDGATGVHARARSADILLAASGDIHTHGDGATAIDAWNDAGTISLAVQNVATSGSGSTAINAASLSGDVQLTIFGTVSSAQHTAISVHTGIENAQDAVGLSDAVSPVSTATASIYIAAGGIVQGAENGIVLSTGGSASIRNNGRISAGTGYAIDVLRGAVSIDNSGVIDGRIRLADGDDLLTNRAILSFANDVDFGAGNDRLVNSGIIRLKPLATAQSLSMNRLESLTNSGLIDLRTGIAGDRLIIGSYFGSDTATLAIDLTLGTTPVVDRLDVTRASGSTTLMLNRLSGTPMLMPATTIIQASAASSPTAFTLDTTELDQPLVQFGFVYDPVSFAYQLVSAPTATVYRQSKLAEGLNALWHRSADAIETHIAVADDARFLGNGAGSTVWFEALGEVSKRDDQFTPARTGFDQSISVNYQQDAFGAQFGVDLRGASGPSGGTMFGISAGYLNSRIGFGNTADRFNVNAVNGALFASLLSGSFRATGLVKYDHYWVDGITQAAGRFDTQGSSIGAKAEAGFRVGSDRLSAQPTVSLAFVRTTVDGYMLQGGRFDFDDFDGLRGKAGLRIAGSAPLGGARFTYYASGMAVREFKGDDALRFTYGESIVVRNNPVGTYGQGILGLSIGMASGINGFVEGNTAFGEDFKAAGGRVGLNIPL